MQTYIVQQGDTLYGISKQFGVSVDEIKRENNLSSNTITPGKTLKIPTIETTSLYIVKKGDSLYSIAQKYNTTVSELVRINNLKTQQLSIGQQLRIPVNDNGSSNYIIYTVKLGDNLYSIAKKYNASVLGIKALNSLTSDLLSIGQQLKIPISQSTGEADSYQTYIVKAGDTLYKIAVLYGMSVDELIQINNLMNTNLSIGQELKVKKKESQEIPSGVSCYGEGYVKPTYVTYTVKRGDSLYMIAKKYNTSIENLIALNDLKSNNLSIGQVLKIKEVNA